MIDFMKLRHGSDIRGVAAEGIEGEEVTLTEEVAGAIGGSFAYWLGFKVGKNPYDLRICVGHDPRLSADELTSGLLKGITMFGAEASDAGLAATPAMFMSTILPNFDFDGAVMITAGHLPSGRNGFKFFTKEGALEAEDVASILKTASRYNFVGEYYEERPENVLEMYAAYLRQMISMGLKEVPGGLKDMRIVVDAGNGSGGFFATEVLEKLGADISGSKYLDADGSFPNRPADPADPEVIASVRKAVRENNADLGIAFGADAGKAVFFGPGGIPLCGNKLAALAAAIAAEDHPGGTVVTDSLTSNELHEFLEEKLGFKHVMYRRGFRNAVSKAKELRAEGEDAFLAAGTSGFAAYSDNCFLDDGIFLAVQLVINAAQLKSQGKNIAALIEGLGSPEEAKTMKYEVESNDLDGLAARIFEDMKVWAAETAELELSEPSYEGVRVNYDIEGNKGWFLLSKALHDPVLALNIESGAAGGTDKALTMIGRFLRNYEEVIVPSTRFKW